MGFAGAGGRFDRVLVTLAVGCALLVAAGVVAYGGASNPRVFLVAGVLVWIPFIVYAAYIYPAAALSLSFVLLLVAGTKFRQRDALATLAGEVDAQVRFEIGVFAAIGIVLLLAVLRQPAVLSRLRAVEVLLLVYVALAIVSGLWSPSTMFTLVRAVQLAILFGLAVVASRSMPTGRLLRALAGALLLYVLTCALLSAVFPWAGGGYVDYRGTRRFSWFSVHPIFAATMVALCALLLIALLLFGARGWRERLLGLPVWLYLIPLGGLIVATNSRGPTAALFAGTGALLVRKHLRVWTVLLLVAVTVGLVFFFASTGESMGDILTSIAQTDPRVAELLLRGQRVQDLETFSGRTELWSAAWPLLLERPILGLGFQGSRAALLAATPWAAYAHNALLQTLLDLGLVGTVLLWGTLVYATVTSMRPLRAAPLEVEWGQATAFALLTFLLVNSVTSESFAAAPGIEWLLLLVAVFIAAQASAHSGRSRAETVRRVAR